MLHPWAKAAAMPGRCIFRQNANAFWDYHDWIFAHQEEIKPENLKDKVLEFAKGKGMDALQLSNCIDSKDTEAEVNKTQAMGRNSRSTPLPRCSSMAASMVGRMDWPTLQRVIDYEIDYQKTAKNAGEDCGCGVSLPGRS